MGLPADVVNRRMLEEECGRATYARGLDYFKRGMATVIEAVTDDSGELFLRTTSHGSGGRSYQQEITVTAEGGFTTLEGACECPVAYNCKHVVAACLAWSAQQRQQSSADAFDEWLRRFAAAGREAPTPREALLYLLRPSPQDEGSLVVSAVVSRLRNDGRWGKGRRAKLHTLLHPYSDPAYVTPRDRQIIGLLGSGNPYLYESNARLTGVAGRAALDLMLESGRLFFGEDRDGPLRPGEPRSVTTGWGEGPSGRLALELTVAGGGYLLPVQPPCYVDAEQLLIGPLELHDLTVEQLLLIAAAPSVEPAMATRVARRILLDQPLLPPPVSLDVDTVEQPPVPRLTLDFDSDTPVDTRLELGFRYGDCLLEAGSDVTTVETRGRLLQVRRDHAAESAALERLGDDPALQPTDRPGRFALRAGGGRQAALQAWFGFVDNTLPGLRALGWEIQENPGAETSFSRDVEIEGAAEPRGNDWFELRFDIEVDGQRLPLLPLVSQLLEDYRPGSLPETLYLDLGEGRYGAIDAARIAPVLDTIIGLYDRAPGAETVEISRFDAPRLLDLQGIAVRGGETLYRLGERLADFQGIAPVTLPDTFASTLRGYQQRGLDWLQFLREYQLAGILADDMGLGKTIQALAHLEVERHAGRMNNPSLVVAPTSLMGNWRREAARFAPRLRTLVLHGPDRAAWFDRLGEYDLVLTTYPLLPRDAEVLRGQSWYYLVLDEAQQVKNPRSQAARLVRELSAEHRLCLTGTPMENHLGELWTQFDFLLPGFLGSQEDFSRRYRTPIEIHDDEEVLDRLNRRTAPFMLRRTKELVAAELPAKTELLRSVPIEGRQASLYESIRLTMEKRVREALRDRGLARSHITVLDALLKLRQVCCDPRLLPDGTPGAAGAGSAKLDMLMELLPELLDEGRRILLFSQFTSMLALVEQELKNLGIAYAKLTGRTRRRDETIQRFRDGEVDLFLISLKAGGTGLNLTEADTVIHYDPWWNPAVETQATDRAHRIGQQRPVFVYKLITEGTVEEKILALQAGKRRLAGNIYGRGEKRDEPALDAGTIEALLGAD